MKSSFADRMLDSIDDIVQGVRGWTKADHTQYFPIMGPHSNNVLALRNGSLLSVIRLDGYMGQYFPDAFGHLRERWAAFMRTASRDKTAAGFDLFWSYEYDPGGMAEQAMSYRQRMIQASKRRGLDVRDILEEEAALYGGICARETQLILIVTHLDSLSKADQKTALESARKSVMGAARGAGSITLQAGVKAIEAIHEQHVNKITNFLKTAGMGYTFSRLDCYAALKAMRSSIMPSTTETWKAKLTMNDCRFRSTERVRMAHRDGQGDDKPLDWTFTLPPPLPEQMIPDGIVDLGRYVVVGDRTYAPMYVSELAIDPAPLEELLRACHQRRLPIRMVYTLMANSDQANYWNRLFAGIFTFASASNRQINKADKAMKAYQEGNGTVYGYGISVTTWAETDVTFRQDGAAQYSVKEVQKRAGNIETLLQAWGGQQVDNIFGCSIEALMGASPGYAMPPTSPRAPQIEMDILTQLPLMRPASLWEPDAAIWFRTADGVLSPYQPMSGNQSSMLQLVMGGMGFGKSNYLSENVFFFANHPAATITPYIRGIDFGASSSGVIDMIRQSLPPERQHEAMFEIFSATGGMVKNLLDCPLGMRYPLEAHKRFLISWLTILCDGLLEDAGVNNLVAVLTAALDKAYELRDPRHQLFEPVIYDHANALPVVQHAVDSIGYEIDEYTHYWEVTDALIDYGIKNNDNKVLHAAKVAQRWCMPRFSDLIMVADRLHDQFKDMPDVSGKGLVSAVVNSLLNANKLFPVFSGVTNTDISESRICVFDMSEAFGRGTSEYDDWMRSVYFAVVYRLLTEDLLVNKALTGEEILNNAGRLGVSEQVVSWHEKYLETQDQSLKLFWADELHRLGRVRGALDILDSIAMEGRKYRVGLMLGTQMANHFPPMVLQLATSAFIFGVNQSSKLAEGLRELFDLTDDECRSLVNITKPNAEKGSEVFVIHRVDSGVQRMLLHFQLGAIKRWAYATEGNERALRGILYAEGRSTQWARRILAAKVPSVGSAIKAKQTALSEQLSEAQIIRVIADELLRMDFD